MKVLTHYGKTVFYQISKIPFKDVLRENKVTYTDLPILGVDVIQYATDGRAVYALICRTGEYEEVYITGSIPLDLDWAELRKDCKGQLNGEAPTELITKARLILDLAYATVEPDGPADLFDSTPFPSSEAVRSEIAKLGYTIDDLKNMNHHDIDPKIWKEICEVE